MRSGCSPGVGAPLLMTRFEATISVRLDWLDRSDDRWLRSRLNSPRDVATHLGHLGLILRAPTRA
jgi:hypothetical protein